MSVRFTFVFHVHCKSCTFQDFQAWTRKPRQLPPKYTRSDVMSIEAYMLRSDYIWWLRLSLVMSLCAYLDNTVF